MNIRALGFSMIEQALTSLTTLMLTMGMVWASGPAAFGQFIFIFTTVLVAASLQFGLVGTPMLVHVRPLDSDGRKLALLKLWRVDFYLRKVSAVIVAVAAYWATRDSLVALAAGVFCWSYMWRESTRNAMFACDMGRHAVILAAVVLLVLAVLFPLLVAAGAVTSPLPPLLAAAAANIIGLVALPFAKPAWPGPITRTARDYRDAFPNAGWSFWGSAANEAQTRAHVFFVGATRGADQLGILEAGRFLFAPLLMMSGAWQRAMQPQLSALVASGDIVRARRLTLSGVAIVSAIGAVYCFVIFLAFDMLSARLFRGRFGDLTPFIACWAIYTMLLLVNWTLSSFLNAMHAYGRLAKITAVAAAATLCALLIMVTGVPLISALVVLIAVQSGVTVCLLAQLWSVDAPLPEEPVEVGIGVL